MKLKEKVVIITGATKGLGLELAKSLVNEGCHVIICARSEKELEKTAKELKVKTVVADVTNEEQVNKLAETAIKNLGRIDIWINNAGIWIPNAPIEETDWKRVHQMMEVNLFGTIYGSKVALMQMKKQQSGTIINILSTSALEGRPGLSGYAATKFAGVGFTQSLRKEVEQANVQVISVYPGGMKTHLFDEKKPENYEKFMDSTYVSDKIIANLKKETPEEELVIRRPA